MRVERLRASAFRCYAHLEIELGDGVTAIVGPNGAGKTSLLEAVHFGCLGWSPRTSDEARLVADGEQLTRVEVSAVVEGRATEVAVGFRPGQPKRVTVDGTRPQSLDSLTTRFPILVFTPDRLAVVKGAPATRRAYFDRAAARRWPAAGATGREFARALAQRNHLLRRIRAGGSDEQALDPWDEAVANAGAALSAVRARLVDLLEPAFAARLESLGGTPATPALAYRPHGPVDAEGLREVLRRRRRRDIERALTGSGPQLDDVVFVEARDVRTYGSQGEQRSALLALVLAEADTLAEARGERPLLLLDDVASELDRERRSRLLEALRAPGQTLLTTTQADELAAAVSRTIGVRARPARRSGLMDGLEPLGDVIGGALPETAGRAADVAAIARRWPEAVGEAIAREAWPARLTPDGELVVHASASVWASELSHLERDLRARLEAVGIVPAPRLRFTVGPVPRRPDPEAATRVAADPPADPRADRWTSAIRDPELRETVSRAARSWLARVRGASGPDHPNC